MRDVEIDVPDLLIVRIDHQDFLRRLHEIERLEAIEMESGDAGRHAERVRGEGELSGQDLGIVLLHALDDPRLENAGVGEIGDEIGRLLAGPDSLLVAHPRMRGIAAERTRRAGHDREIDIEGEPADIA